MVGYGIVFDPNVQKIETNFELGAAAYEDVQREPNTVVALYGASYLATRKQPCCRIEATLVFLLGWMKKTTAIAAANKS